MTAGLPESFFALSNNPDEPVNIPLPLLKGFLERVFDGKTKHIDNDVWQETYKQLSGAVDTGFMTTDFGKPDWMLAQNLKYNAATFAAFKNHSEVKKLQKLLFDGKGVKKWTEFRDEALKLTGKYNVTWLQTEYNHAAQSARMARKWQDMQGDTDLYPNLKYIAVRDKRTRPSHEKLHGAIYPANHKFWDTHTPPNDYGCRCSIRQTREPVKEADEIPVLPEMFQNNPGKTGMIFTEGHNYFKGATKAEKAFIENVVGKRIKPPEVVKKSYNKYNAYGKDYIKPTNGFNFDNGGYTVYHKNHIFNKQTGKYEKLAAEVLRDNGEQVVLVPEKKTKGLKNPDGTIGSNKAMELKAILSDNPNSIKRNIEKAARQGADVVVLYFKDYDKNRFDEGLAKWFGVAEKEELDIKIMYIENGTLRYI